LIGLAAIMLLVNAAVTVLPQAVTGVLGWRGKNLVRGLVTILNQLDPKITVFCTQQIALGVVRHPLIARDEGKVETVIQREEPTRCWYEPPTHDYVWAGARAGRTRPRASGLWAALFARYGDPEHGALNLAWRAEPRVGDPDGDAADPAGALPSEPGELAERVERDGTWAQTGSAGARVPSVWADDMTVPSAAAVAPQVAGPCVPFVDVPAPLVDAPARWRVDDTTVPPADAVVPSKAGQCAQVAGGLGQPGADKPAWTASAG